MYVCYIFFLSRSCPKCHTYRGPNVLGWWVAHGPNVRSAMKTCCASTVYTVLRAIPEYASPVWHSACAQTEVLETLQRRAVKTINSDDRRSEIPVGTNCDTLRACRQVLTERLFIRNVTVTCCRKIRDVDITLTNCVRQLRKIN